MLFWIRLVYLSPSFSFTPFTPYVLHWSTWRFGRLCDLSCWFPSKTFLSPHLEELIHSRDIYERWRLAAANGVLVVLPTHGVWYYWCRYVYHTQPEHKAIFHDSLSSIPAAFGTGTTWPWLPLVQPPIPAGMCGRNARLSLYIIVYQKSSQQRQNTHIQHKVTTQGGDVSNPTSLHVYLYHTVHNPYALKQISNPSKQFTHANYINNWSFHRWWQAMPLLAFLPSPRMAVGLVAFAY